MRGEKRHRQHDGDGGKQKENMAVDEVERLEPETCASTKSVTTAIETEPAADAALSLSAD
jgi:hypothetical protein